MFLGGKWCEQFSLCKINRSSFCGISPEYDTFYPPHKNSLVLGLQNPCVTFSKVRACIRVYAMFWSWWLKLILHFSTFYFSSGVEFIRKSSVSISHSVSVVALHWGNDAVISHLLCERCITGPDGGAVWSVFLTCTVVRSSCTLVTSWLDLSRQTREKNKADWYFYYRSQNALLLPFPVPQNIKCLIFYLGFAGFILIVCGKVLFKIN